MTVPSLSISNTTDEQEQFAIVERRARRFWVSLIVGFLGIQVLIGVGSIYLALGDPSVAIIPNYHQSALDWDLKHRAQLLLDDLGWQVTILITPDSEMASPPQARELGIRITNQGGVPIEKLHIEAKWFHHARGQQVHQALLSEIEPGFYATPTTLNAPGLWQVSLSIEGDHGIASLSREVEVP